MVKTEDEKRMEAQESPEIPDFAYQPDLVNRITDDIAALGLVGERRNGLLIYLTATSRLLDEPLQVIVMGVTTSGKSEIIKRVLSMMPEDQAFSFTEITRKALLYVTDPYAYCHKWLAIGERKHDDTADGTSILRQLQSEQHVAQLRPDKDEKTNKTKEKLSELYGPIACTQTTTLSENAIHREDRNRHLLAYTKVSEDHTDAIMRSITNRNTKPTNGRKERDAAIIARHKLFQSALQVMPVHIPYLLEIERVLPRDSPEIIRLYKHMITVIQAVTLLHQFQRETKDGELVATVDDYKIAKRVLDPIYGRSATLTKKQKEYFEKIVRKSDPFRRGDFDGSSATIQKAIDAFLEYGLIELIKPKRGKMAAVYGWTGREMDEIRALPTL